MERARVITAAMGGGSGHKPRPVLVVQASDFESDDTLVVVPFTSGQSSDLTTKPVFRPDGVNGLLEASSLMTHRISAVRKSDVGTIIGKLSPDDMERVDLALALVLGLQTISTPR